jgi:hypothetical protein
MRVRYRRVRQVAIRRRPKLTACGDPARDQAVAVNHGRLLKLLRRSVVLAEDQTRLHPWCRSGRITRIQ